MARSAKLWADHERAGRASRARRGPQAGLARGDPADPVLAILYYTAPNVRQPGFRWVSEGSVLAVVLWLVASALFAAYVATREEPKPRRAIS
jgi:hypothetical protein